MSKGFQISPVFANLSVRDARRLPFLVQTMPVYPADEGDVYRVFVKKTCLELSAGSDRAWIDVQHSCKILGVSQLI
jgi:hypothetical protein